MTQVSRTEQAREAGKHIHHFHGGLRLRHNKKISCQVSVERPAMPDILIVPLLQHAGDTADSMVRVGEYVLKGQQIGPCANPRRPDMVCAAIHAPTSGTIEAIEDRPMTHPSGNRGTCVVIRPDGKDQWLDPAPIDDWLNASHETIIRQLQFCGLAGLGGAVFPTHAKTRDGLERNIHTLILNGAECEPYISCDEMLMRERPERIVLGARVLRRALGAERVVIAIEDQMGAVYEALTYAASQSDCTNVSVVRVAKIYPEGGERQLIQVLTGLEVPAGGRPSDLGLVCQNVATAAAAAEAVVAGKPLIERYITVTGNGIRKPRNLLALIGTPFYHLVAASGGYSDDVARLVVGGPMMGFPVAGDDNPVVKASNCILALTVKDIATPQAEMPCIRCGECARACPATLLPQQLHMQIKNGQWEQAEEYGLKACIECGCCDFVCPSHIPLVDWFRYGKGELRQRSVESEATDRARERFEARQERLQRKQQERAEKMAERKRKLKQRAKRRKRSQATDTLEPGDTDVSSDKEADNA